MIFIIHLILASDANNTISEENDTNSTIAEENVSNSTFAEEMLDEENEIPPAKKQKRTKTGNK